jgi:hypothetical protein
MISIQVHIAMDPDNNLSPSSAKVNNGGGIPSLHHTSSWHGA